jgi:hypothetical protein
MKPVRHLALTTLLSTACSLTFAVGSDDLWEMNISINTGGHNMPLQAMQNCMPKGQDHPTPPDKTCKVSSQGGLIGKGGMLMECAGPPPYTVKIEGTLTANSMKGTMTVNSGGTTMVQEFTGKVVGSCDVATFAQNPQAGMTSGGGMSAAGRRMPSFDPMSRPSKQSSQQAATEVEPVAEPSAEQPVQSKKGNAVDAAKKALGGLFGL